MTAVCCGQYLASGECCAAVYGTDRLVQVPDEPEPPPYWALANPWDPTDPNRGCFTCGAPPTHRFMDGSPAYRNCHHPPVYPSDLPDGWEPAVAPLTYTLTPAERDRAEACARRTYANDRRLGRTWQQGTRAMTEADRLAKDRIGCEGEIAFARLTGLPWRCHQQGIGKPDVGRYQVRTITQPSYRLIVHDPDGTPVVLVLAEGGGYRLVGWLPNAAQGKVPRYLKDPHAIRPAWFVPQDALDDPRTIPELARKA